TCTRSVGLTTVATPARRRSVARRLLRRSLDDPRTSGACAREGRDAHMLSYAITFFVIALIAAALGFSGVAGMSANIGWLLAVLGVVVLAIGVLNSRLGGGTRSLP